MAEGGKGKRFDFGKNVSKKEGKFVSLEDSKEGPAGSMSPPAHKKPKPRKMVKKEGKFVSLEDSKEGPAVLAGSKFSLASEKPRQKKIIKKEKDDDVTASSTVDDTEKHVKYLLSNPNIGEAERYLDNLNVDDLRKCVSELMKKVYCPLSGRRKPRNFYQKVPMRWDPKVRFCNPTNISDGQENKPNKSELVQMALVAVEEFKTATVPAASDSGLGTSSPLDSEENDMYVKLHEQDDDKFPIGNAALSGSKDKEGKTPKTYVLEEEVSSNDQARNFNEKAVDDSGLSTSSPLDSEGVTGIGGVARYCNGLKNEPSSLREMLNKKVKCICEMKSLDPQPALDVNRQIEELQQDLEKLKIPDKRVVNAAEDGPRANDHRNSTQRLIQLPEKLPETLPEKLHENQQSVVTMEDVDPHWDQFFKENPSAMAELKTYHEENMPPSSHKKSPLMTANDPLLSATAQSEESDEEMDYG